MTIRAIYINLPAKDLNVSRAFWSALGFTFNEQFSNEQALCLVLSEGQMYAMLIAHDMFSSFTNRPIADGSTTQVLNAIEVDSREQVDEMIQLALAHGATRYRESADHGWMYYDSFADPDGHQWEILFSDTTLLPQ
jgi:predicted lactoylglutathione lyase